MFVKLQLFYEFNVLAVGNTKWPLYWFHVCLSLYEVMPYVQWL